MEDIFVGHSPGTSVDNLQGTLAGHLNFLCDTFVGHRLARCNNEAQNLVDHKLLRSPATLRVYTRMFPVSQWHKDT